MKRVKIFHPLITFVNEVHCSFQGFITYLSIQDPGQEVRQGYNEEKSVSVWTPGGRKKVLNPLHPNIRMHILNTFLSTFLTVLTRRICVTI